MAEYVNRKALGERLLREGKFFLNWGVLCFRVEDIENVKVSDSVELVRCKDCKHRDILNNACLYPFIKDEEDNLYHKPDYDVTIKGSVHVGNLIVRCNTFLCAGATIYTIDSCYISCGYDITCNSLNVGNNLYLSGNNALLGSELDVDGHAHCECTLTAQYITVSRMFVCFLYIYTRRKIISGQAMLLGEVCLYE